MKFSETYLGKLRQVVGSRLLMVAGGRAVLENSDGKLLLHKRSDFNVWAFPGGGAEEGESAEDCIVREVLEETGLEIKNFEAIGFASNPQYETVVYPNGDVTQNYCLILYATDGITQQISLTLKQPSCNFLICQICRRCRRMKSARLKSILSGKKQASFSYIETPLNKNNGRVGKNQRLSYPRFRSAKWAWAVVCVGALLFPAGRIIFRSDSYSTQRHAAFGWIRLCRLADAFH